MKHRRRGFQGKRYKLEDLEHESVIFLTTDQVQTAFFRMELIENGELPERCKTCRFMDAMNNDKLSHDRGDK